MTLANAGLISSQVSATTITINPASLTNTGTLEAKNGGTLTIAPTGTWTSAGTISVNASTVNLGGTFDATGGIGTWSNSGASTVNITGTLLAGSGGNTLTLSNATGSWTLSGGTISGGAMAFADGKGLFIAANSANLLSGVAVERGFEPERQHRADEDRRGDDFVTAHLSGSQTELGFAPGATLSGTILFEGASGNQRWVTMNGSAGTFSIGAGGVIRTETGFASNSAFIGAGNNFGGNMTLANAGLISSQVSATTITVNPASLTNTGTLEAKNGGHADDRADGHVDQCGHDQRERQHGESRRDLRCDRRASGRGATAERAR